MTSITHSEYFEMYKGAEPLRHVANGEQGELFFNGRQATEIAYKTALSCMEIPKAFYERSSIDLRNRILKEKVAEYDGALLVASYGEYSVGVLPQVKRDSYVSPSLLRQMQEGASEVELTGHPLRDKRTYLWRKSEEFELPGDSKYYIGPFALLHMWGPYKPMVTLRLLRETCTNGATAMVEAANINFEGRLLESFMTTMLRTAEDTGKQTAHQLELMKERSYELDMLLADPHFEALPKISRKKVALTIDRMRQGQEQIEDALVNTQFGAFYAITAAAREYSDRVKANVESVGWNYLHGLMEAEKKAA